MKKSLFLAALATIALASCTQNEDFSQPEKISFNPVNYKAQSTKAPINTTTYSTTDPSFGVFAFWSETKDWSLTADADLKQYVGSNGSGVMINFNNQWKSETDYYWPLSGKLTFIGYTPYYYGNLSTNGPVTASYAKSTKTLSITGFSAQYQDDLMYTLPSDAKDLTANTVNYVNGTTSYTGVPIKFRHALSQIVVKAKVADTYTDATFTINSISLQGMNDIATLNMGETVTNSTVSPNGAWSWDEDTKLENALFQILDDEIAVSYTTGDVPQVGDAVLVIPQDLENNQQKLVVSYSMTFNGVKTTTSKDVYLNSGTNDALTELAMGKKYTLNLTLYADRILYSPSVAEDWDATANNGSSDYDVPEQPTQNP